MAGEEDPAEVRLLTAASSTHSNGRDCRGSKSQVDSPVTPMLVLSALVAVCCPFACGCALGYSSPTESAIMEDLGLSVAAYSLFASMLTMGGIIASLVSGTVTDIVGRKRTMWICDACFFVGCLSMAFAENAWWLDFGRLFTGFGVGIASYAIPVYIAEITPRTVRGAFTAMYQLMLSSGFSFTYFLGTIISWRALAIVGGLPCVVQLFGLFFVPESPRWLARVGSEREFEIELQRLRGRDAEVSEEMEEIRDYTRAFEQQSESRIGILELFHARYFYPLMIGVGVMLLSQFSGVNAISSYASSIVESADYSGSVASIAIAIIQIPVSVVSMMLTDKAGRRPLMMISGAGMCLSSFLIGLSFLMKDLGHWEVATPVLVFVGVVAYYAFLCFGMLGLPWVIMSEIFPVNVKAVAGSLVTFVSWACSWIVSYSFNFMFDWSSYGTFFIFSGMSAFAVVFVAKFVPETKGRALEELQASLSKAVR